jgi:SAM-dependent methyltransferase
MQFEDRTRAESFGAVAAQYDRARPTYPRALLDELVTPDALTVLDVGCGTGIATALLADRGLTVLGVEVDARMAAVARRKGFDVEVARFEDWQPQGRQFDLVISAQAWHWIEPQAGARRAAEALGRGGQIGVFWNFGEPPDDVRELLSPVYARLGPSVERYSALFGNRDARARATLAGIADIERFAAPEARTFTWTKSYDTHSWLEQLMTHSDHRALPPTRRRDLLAAVGDAIDSIGGSFEMTYQALLITARKR